ncbi:MAG: alpha/beta hydrolase [Verrucomicrobiales bacterium]
MTTDIFNSAGEKLDFAFHGNSEDFSNLVLIGHGVTGNKDRTWIESFANQLAAASHNAVRFSFSGNGDSQGEFGESTVSKEVGDLGAMIDAAERAGYENITVIGHSMGGAVGVIRAASDARIKKLISLAGMVYTAKFNKFEFSDQTPDSGFMWDEEDCPYSQTFVDDMNSIDNVLAQGEKISVPWLLVHGTADDVVPIQESHDIFEKATTGDKKLVELADANHVFSNDGLQPMIDTVIGWLNA